MDKEYIINDAIIVTSLNKVDDSFRVVISYSKDTYSVRYKAYFKYDDGIEYINDSVKNKLDNMNFDRFVLNFEKIDDNRFQRCISYHKDIRKVFGVLLSEITRKSSMGKRKSTRRIGKKSEVVSWKFKGN